MGDLTTRTINRIETDYRNAKKMAVFYLILDTGAQLIALLCTTLVTLLLALIHGKYISDSMWPIITSGIATLTIGLPKVFRADVYAKASRIMTGELLLCLQKLEAGIINLEAALNWRQFIQNEYNKAVDSDSKRLKATE